MDTVWVNLKSTEPDRFLPCKNGRMAKSRFNKNDFITIFTNCDQSIMYFFVTIIVAMAVASSSASNVRMEPSVDVFSSSKWIKEKSLKDSDVIKAVFVLKHEISQIKSFEKKLLDISSPKSANYGKWMKV